MEFTCYSMLIDFTIAAIFLFVAKLLREKIKILQSLFIPVSRFPGPDRRQERPEADPVLRSGWFLFRYAHYRCVRLPWPERL